VGLVAQTTSSRRDLDRWLAQMAHGDNLHSIAESIDETAKIEAGYLGTVRNALIVFAALPWPAELANEQQALAKELKGLEAALVANKPDEAHMAADAVHEAEHDFSEATFAWLGTQKHDPGAIMPMITSDNTLARMAVTGVRSAQAYLESAAFHEMADQLDKTKQIQPGYVGTTRNAITVTGMAPWPSELATEQKEMISALRKLETALVTNKPEEAGTAADTLHEAEHDLSQATFAWLKTKTQ
jgi:hypothetical protein